MAPSSQRNLWASLLVKLPILVTAYVWERHQRRTRSSSPADHELRQRMRMTRGELRSSTPGSLSQVRLAFTLGEDLLSLWVACADPAFLRQSVAVRAEALTAALPARPELVESLGKVMQTQHLLCDITGLRSDWDYAVRLGWTVVVTAGPDHPQSTTYRAALQHALAVRYGLKASPEAIGQAIEAACRDFGTRPTSDYQDRYFWPGVAAQLTDQVKWRLSPQARRMGLLREVITLTAAAQATDAQIRGGARDAYASARAGQTTLRP